MEAIALRLSPHQDLKAELDQFVRDRSLAAACILTCVGSLTRAVLRLANQTQATVYEGPFEIVSLTGVMSCHGSHYHIAIANSQGYTWGGHLLEGNLIHTTAELVIGVMPYLRFQREYDAATGYRELAIVPLPDPISINPNHL